MADERAGIEGQSNARGAAKVTLDPEEEWKRAVAQRRGYTIRNTKAMAAGILAAVVISVAIIGGLLILIGGWDFTFRRGEMKLLVLLSMPGIIAGIWVREKLKVPNS